MNTPGEDPSMQEISRLHAEVDAAVARVAERQAARINCRRGCSDCCRDDLTVFDVEAARIRASHGELLKRGTPHAVGRCAFLDAEGACRIYDVRPYVCRTQGVPMRWFEEGVDEEIEEQRDICPLNAEGPELRELSEEDLWLLGPYELELSKVQRSRTGDERRVSLRSLFSASSPPIDGPEEGPA